MGAERGRLGERGVSEMYGTLLIISLAFAVTVLLVGFGFLLLDDSLDETETQVAQDSVTEFEQRVSSAIEGAGNQTVWQPPPGTEDQFSANESQGQITVHVETTGAYWNVTDETLSRPGELVESTNQRTITTRNLGTLAYENDDGSTTAYQGGAVFRRQGQSVEVQEPPALDISDGQLQFGLVDLTSLDQVSGGDLQIQARSLGTNQIQRTIERALQREGDVVAEGRVQLTITSEYADGWADYAEEEIEGVDSGDIYRSGDRPELGENQVLIDLGTFGEGLRLDDRSEPPVVYSGATEFAAELHNTSAGTLRNNNPGFEVVEPDPDNYTVGIYAATSETDDQREWWAYNESAEHWENVERSNREISPKPGRGGAFQNVYGENFLIDDDTVTCVVDTSAPGDEFRDFVAESGEGCLDDPIGVEEPANLEADFEPYLEVSGLDVTGPRQLEPNVETLDVDVTVENTGPGNATSESVALYLDDQREDGRGQVLLADAKTNITRDSTDSVIDTTVDPHFLYESGEGGVPFRLGAVTDNDQNLTADDEPYRIGYDAAINITSFDLDDDTITAGEPITGEIELTTNETGSIDTSGLVTAGPNAVGFVETFSGSTTTSFTLNTDPTRPDFDDVTVAVPGEDNATEDIDVIDPRSDPEFRVQDVQFDPADRNVSVGEELRVDATIKNVGNARDTQPVQLANTDTGIIAAEGAVTLDPGEDTTVELIWEPTARAATDFPESEAFVFTSDNRSELRTVTVDSTPEDDGDFDLSLNSLDSEVIAGQKITAEVTVANAGTEEATRAVWMEAEDGTAVFDKVEPTLTAGDTTTVTLTWRTDRSDARPDQGRSISIRTREDEETIQRDVTVFRRSDAPDPTIASVAPANQTVTEGAVATVDVTVENPDTSPAAGVVVLETDEGVPVDSVDVTPMASGESQTVSLSWDTVIGDAGRRNLTVSVGTDAVTADVEVQRRYNPRDVAFVHDESRSMVAREDTEDVNARVGVRLADDVEGIEQTAFRISPGEVTVPGTQSDAYWNLSSELRSGMDRVWRAETANGSTDYFHTGDTVDLSNYETIEILRPYHRLSDWESDTGMTTVTAADDEIWYEISYCLFACPIASDVLPNETASTIGEGFAGFSLTKVAEVDVEDGMPNPGAEFYTVGNDAYRHLGALESEEGTLDSLSESTVTAWQRGSNFTDIVPAGQSWDRSQGLNYGLYRTGEDPGDPSRIDIYAHGADPFAQRHNLTRSLIAPLDPTLDQAGYLQYDNDVETQTDLSAAFNGTLTTDFDQVNATLQENRDDPADLTAGIQRGADVLTGPDAKPTSEPIMVLFSDGTHNYGGTTPVEAAEAASAEGVTIYTVGLGDRVRTPSTEQGQRLRAIANATGGEFLLPSEVDGLADQFDRDDFDSITLDRPEFEVEVADDNLGTVQFGETVSVTAEVTNVGNATGEQPVWLTERFGDTVAAQDSVTLAPGNSTEVTFTWQATARDPAFGGGDPPTATSDLVARTGADSDAVGLTIEDDPAEYVIEEVLTSEPVTPTEELTVRATIRNAGGASSGPNPDQIWLRTRQGVPVEFNGISLPGGDQTTTEFQWDLSEYQVAGDRTAITVSSDDDSASRSVAVDRAAALPAFEVQSVVTNANANNGQSVEAGNPVQVWAEVTNTGSREATQFVELSAREFDAGAVDVQPLELAPGETRNISMRWQTTVRDVADDEPVALGSVRVRTENGSGQFSDTVAIRPYDPDVDFELEIINDPSSQDITAGEDTLEVDVRLRNAPTASDSDEGIVAIRDVDDPPRPSSALVLKDFGELSPGQTETATLEYQTGEEDYTIDEIEASVARYSRVSVTEAVDIDEPTTDSEIGFDTVQTNAQSRPAAITAGDVPLVVDVELDDDLSGGEEAVVSLYAGTSADPDRLLDTRTFTDADGTLSWQPEPGDGNNTAPQQVTVAVRGTTQTEAVYINEAPSKLLDFAESEGSDPVRVEVDEVEVTS